MGGIEAGIALQTPRLIPPVKTILITGVTRGLGRAMAAKFIALGHAVIGCGRSPDEIQRLRHEFGPPNDFSAVDVANDSRVAAWAGRVLKSHSAPGLLLNNAAIIARNAPLWEVPAREFSDVIDINIKGVVNVIRHFLPAMLKRRSGIIVNFSSGWGRSADANAAPYCATKWAIEGLTQALARELPDGMAAVPLNPGIIDTDMLRSCFGGSAGDYPGAAQWAETAVPFLLKLTPAENGRPLTVPQSAA
ncbi:MAG: SDR family NAD(P)-dependent oxidoreductase [Verrucomicrobia bacterium]|nr:SDR family NAD(P)-dependent oxidoreductase [Verrucomicrobiota bacterium]MDE3098928.1 SDR family NAD(P)-dependent oxidoreductase [Verrucomicrobiota bacterium]